MIWTLGAIGAVIVVGLGIYAGRLLFLLQAQTKRHQAARDKRIQNMTESIQTIAFAMHQQQYDLSEGAIRICSLLAALPLDPLPDYKQQYPALHELFDKIQHYPTHEARNALSKSERRGQDKERGQFESELESAILAETEKLKGFEV